MSVILPAFNHFYFVRHGRTDANVRQIMAGGHNDIPLNEEGKFQAQRAAKIIQEHCEDIQTICVSTMLRARQTAEYINKDFKKNIVEIPELIEWCFGDWEGKTWDEVSHLFLGDHDPQGGESRLEFRSRVATGLQKSLTHPRSVLVVAHGAVWFKILKLLNMNLAKTDNCQVFKICTRPSETKVEYEYFEITAK